MKNNKFSLVISIVVALLFLGVIFWYTLLKKPAEGPPVVEPPAAAPITSPDLGSEVFEKASNPISDKLPETTADVPNPIDDVYKNPFR